MSGYHGRMSDPNQAPPVSVVGYGLGVGLAFTAVVGVFVRFAFAATPALWLLGGAFLVGAALGVLRARTARVDLSG